MRSEKTKVDDGWRIPEGVVDRHPTHDCQPGPPTPKADAPQSNGAYASQRRHSAIFHISLSQPLIRMPCRVFRWAETMPRFTSGIS